MMIGILSLALRTCIAHGIAGASEEEEHSHDSHDDDDSDPTGQEVANAILLSMGAGLCTVLGAGVAFMLKEEDLKKERSMFLAGCLSFAAAVMIYVSFIEIWPESLDHYSDTTEDGQVAHIYTSLTFFGGILLGYLCSKAVEFFEHRQEDGNLHKDKGQDVEMQTKDVPGKDEESQSSSVKVSTFEKDERRSKLLRSAIVTSISIALHNFPEGLVTFYAAVDDWNVGVATAFAIAIHNVPEGISIAAPYYYASESRWKAFVLAFLSGLAEPIGALIGYGIVSDVGDAAYGVMFGVTAGIMVYISFRELLPLARKNDPSDKVTTLMIFVGMFVMDLSLYIGG